MRNIGNVLKTVIMLSIGFITIMMPKHADTMEHKIAQMPMPDEAFAYTQAPANYIPPMSELKPGHEHIPQSKPVSEPVPAAQSKPRPGPTSQPESTPAPVPKLKPEISSSGGNTGDIAPVKPVVIGFGNAHVKQVALTFDDGPDGRFTPQILDILKKHNVKATFFVIGRNAEKYPEVLKRISDEGHVIGNHSWDHKDFTKLTPEERYDEIHKTELLIDRQLGSHRAMFRMPFGAFNDDVVKDIAAQGYYNIYWSVDTEDWSGISPSAIEKNIEDELRPGAIVLMHSSGQSKAISNTVKVLPEVIEMLQKGGYKLVTVPELLK